MDRWLRGGSESGHDQCHPVAQALPETVGIGDARGADQRRRVGQIRLQAARQGQNELRDLAGVGISQREIGLRGCVRNGGGQQVGEVAHEGTIEVGGDAGTGTDELTGMGALAAQALGHGQPDGQDPIQSLRKCAVVAGGGPRPVPSGVEDPAREPAEHIFLVADVLIYRRTGHSGRPRDVVHRGLPDTVPIQTLVRRVQNPPDPLLRHADESCIKRQVDQSLDFPDQA